MNDFIKMDVFFVVTTIVVVVMAVVLTFILFRVLSILRNVDRISKMVGDEGELLRGDVAELRSRVKENGMKLRHFTWFAKKASGIFKGKGRRNN